ncbi:GpE family phage tail protein [Erwinia sp. JH02]|nr:GpE family phage tail protein [Erwinia rhapontici]NNS08066.1 GpE family phage tail protein [Erwinia sp. JH02]
MPESGPGRSDRTRWQGDRFFIREAGHVRWPDDLTVDDLMADIATVFHWPPSEMNPMSLAELIDWRHKAIVRSGMQSGE